MKFLLVVIGILSLYGLSFIIDRHLPGWSREEAFRLGNIVMSYANTAMVGLLGIVGTVVAKAK